MFTAIRAVAILGAFAALTACADHDDDDDFDVIVPTVTADPVSTKF